MAKANEIKDEVLCCCEYLDRHGQTNHLLGICCNCEELDATCESICRGEGVGDQQASLLSEDILDRLRIPNPFGGGAQRIDQLMDLTVLPPIFFIPLGIYISALTPMMTLIICFVVAPASILWYYRKVLRYKTRSQFFMSWALTSFLSMYCLMVFVVYPEDAMSPVEFAAMTLLFAVFNLCFFNTKRGAGVVTLESGPTLNGLSSSPGEKQRRRRNHTNQSNDHTLQQQGLCEDPTTETIIGGAMQERNRCGICNVLRPSRAGHCRICGGCFHRLDHHCVWLDCCIGRDNHRSFILCLLLFVVGSFWGSLRVIVILFGGEEDLLPMCLEVYASRMMAVVFVSALYVLGSGVSVTSLLLHQVWLISHNWTYRERRLARVNPAGVNLKELNRGFLINWKNFLCGNLE